jgi:hypothetical protein
MVRGIARLVLTAACVVLLINNYAVAINLDSLLAASIGGKVAVDSIQRLSSIVYEGKTRAGGLEGRFRAVIVPPDHFYFEMNSPSFSMTQGFDGLTAWQRDQNGQTAELSGFEKKLLLKNLYIESFSYLLPERRGMPPVYRGVEMQDGNEYHVVAFVPYEGDTIIACYNTLTGRREVTGTQVDNLYTVSELGDFRTVSGIVIPFHAVDTVIGLPISSELIIERAAINQPVDMRMFAKPSARASDFRFPTGKAAIKVPFSYLNGQIHVPATLNGRKRVRLILDSGASGNVYHRDAVASLNLPISGYLPARGVSGVDSIALVRMDSIQVGGLTLYNQVAGVLDLKALARATETKGIFGGLLGYDFLSRFPMMVDYHDSVLTVFNPETFTPPAGGIEIPFTLTQQVPTITGSVVGVQGQFVIDLGNAFGLILHRAFVNEHGLDTLLSDFQPMSDNLTGVGGSIGGQSAYAQTFEFGGIKLEAIRAILPEGSTGLTGSTELAGNIGNRILEHFNVLFDYQRSRIILYPLESKKSPTD